jgi:biotin carboxyl carrier protein
MKFKIHVESQTFDVQIDDLNARPVVVMVDGERVEVWPEAEIVRRPRAAEPPAQGAAANASVPASQAVAPAPVAEAPRPAAAAATGGQVVRAPIPGIITKIAVQPGIEVTSGQELCSLEAMKMNNSIRASQAGKIAAVHVTVGQHVKHGEVLMEYAG